MRDREEEVDRALLKCNIHTWKELKTQREEQAYTNTSLKLNITRWLYTLKFVVQPFIGNKSIKKK